MSYTATFIQISEDCPTDIGIVPSSKTTPTMAAVEYRLLTECPYTYDHLDFSYLSHKEHKAAQGKEAQDREIFHSRGQPCLRASALTKRWGWGAHYDETGRIAIYAAGSDSYERLANDANLTQLRAMRNKRK